MKIRDKKFEQLKKVVGQVLLVLRCRKGACVVPNKSKLQTSYSRLFTLNIRAREIVLPELSALVQYFMTF